MTGGSGTTAVEVAGREPAAAPGWEREWGTVSGTSVPDDGVVGLAGPHDWSAGYELIGPAVDGAPGGEHEGARQAVLVDIENRGGRSTFSMLQPEIERGQVAYARVQWQTGIAPGVPEHAQGVGLAILRDFGRHLRERFDVLVMAGASQSAWFVNTFVAEGFNQDPDSGEQDPGSGSGVYAGAFAYLSGGNWLAINRLGDDGEAAAPYARPDGVPLTAARILTRPASDPFLVEISSYTDYYRLRASVQAASPVPARARHYDYPSPHAPGTVAGPDLVFGSLGCNGGHPVPMNPVGAGPAARAALLGLFREVGATGLPDGVPALAPSVFFDLGPAPPASEYFNALAGVDLRVPVVDDDAQPRGGVRFPEVEAPLGRPEPVALPPCGTASITDVCGNFGGWQAFTPEELRARYGSADAYAARYATAYDAMVDGGYAMQSGRDAAVADARAAFTSLLAPRGP